MKALISAIQEAMMSANVPTVPVPLASEPLRRGARPAKGKRKARALAEVP